jgi:hypothetical protein
MTYNDLVTEVSNYMENTFSTEDMNTFITQAETRVYNTIQFPALRKNVTGTLTASNKYLQCPTDFLASHSLAVINPTTGAYSYLLNKDVSFIREAYTVPTATGTPKYYALFGPRSDAESELAFILGPTPDIAYGAELHYFFYPESITTVVGGRTWLGDNFDPVLLYGTLVEAYTLMKGEADLIKLYDDKFKEALLMAKRLGDSLEKQDSYRSGQPKTQIS